MSGDGRAQPGIVANRMQPVAAAIEVDAFEPGHRRCACRRDRSGRGNRRRCRHGCRGDCDATGVRHRGRRNRRGQRWRRGRSRRAYSNNIRRLAMLRRRIRFHQRDNLREGRNRNQSPLLETIRRYNRDQNRDQRPHAQIAPPASPLLRIRIDESIRRRAAETQHVTVLEPLRPANPTTIDERARPELEIGQVVAAARVSDDRMANRDVRIRDVQLRAFGAADRRFTAGQHEQPSARRLAIHRQQSRRLRPLQHLRLPSRATLKLAVIQKTNALPFDTGAVGVSVQYGGSPVALLAALSASSFARSFWQLLWSVW